MATTHDHDTHGPIADSDSSDQGLSKTLLVQGSILGGIIVLLVIASFFDLI
jgi:hypothetical protein